MPAIINELGNKYEKLTVLSQATHKNYRGGYWLCKCECGELRKARGSFLRNGGIRACKKCTKEEAVQRFLRLKTIDETGHRYGGLVVIQKVESPKKILGASWLCQCDCGSTIIVQGGTLRAGHQTSCGCGKHKRESVTKHGMSGTPEYKTWWGMICRCNHRGNTAFRNYGARGIKVAEEWQDSRMGFINFFNHVGEKPSLEHSLDRINNDGDYRPGNVRWATPKEQTENRRKYCTLSKFSTDELLTELRHRNMVL